MSSLLSRRASRALAPRGIDQAFHQAVRRDAGTAAPPPRPRFLREAAVRALVAVFTLQTLTTPAWSQVVRSPSAPANQRPLVDAAGNGVPIVHIAPPNAAGVSRNQYEQFNVDSRGLILNNSTATTQTQLGGYIARNMLLGATPARIVLNEVVSTAPTALRGTIEIAGQRADIVIANPNGIQCDGCGFLNAAARATLTTGIPRLDGQGALQGFDTARGTLTVGGKGLDASGLERLDLIARGIIIDGEVLAQNLRVLAGSNDVLYGTLAATAQASGSAAPRFAIDIRNLGGMYANQIHMVATEQGLGVNSTGRIAALQGNLRLSAQGDITLHDTHALQGMELRSTGAATLTGLTLTAQGDVTVSAQRQITNGGTLQAGRALRLEAPQLANSGSLAQLATDRDLVLSFGTGLINTGTVYTPAGLRVETPVLRGVATAAAPGRLLAGAGITLAAPEIALGHQQIVAGQGVAVRARSLALQDSLVQATGDITLEAASAIDVARSHLQSDADVRLGARALSGTGARFESAGRLTIGATDGLALEGATLRADAGIQVSGQSVTVAGAGMSSGDRIQVTSAEALVADRASIQAGERVDLAATRGIGTAGAVVSAAAIGIDAGTARLDNAGGQLLAAGTGDDALTVTASGIDNRAGRLHANGGFVLDVHGGDVDNAAGVIAAPRGTLRNIERLSNVEGVLAMQNDLALAGTVLDNTRGTVQVGGRLAIATGNRLLDNTGGLMRAGGDLTVDSGTAALRSAGGSIAATGAATLAGAAIDLTDGIVAAGRAAGISAGRLDGARARIGSGGALAMDVADAAVLSGATLAAGANLRLHAGGALVADEATASAAQNLRISASSLDGGRWSAGRDLTVATAGATRLAGGTLVAGGTVAVTARGISTSAGGTVDGAAVRLDAGDRWLDNAKGSIVVTGNAADSLLLRSRQGIGNQGGVIQTAGGAVLDAGAQLDNSGGVLQVQGGLALRTPSVVNRQGTVFSGRGLAYGGDSLDNTGGTVATRGDLDIDAATLASASGTLSAGGLLSLRADTLSASRAQIGGGGGVSIAAAGEADLSAATVASGGALGIRAASVHARGGMFSAATDLDLDAGTVQGGSWSAGGNANAVLHGHADFSDGGLRAGGTLHVRSEGLITDRAELGGTTVTIDAGAGGLRNAGGRIVASDTGAQALNIRARGIDNQGGALTSAGGATIDAGGHAIDNTGGTLQAIKTLSVVADGITNNDGTIASGASIELRNSLLRNARGTIRAGGNLLIDTQDRQIDNAGGRLLALGDLALRTGTGRIASDGGTIAANRSVDVAAQSLDISHGRITAGTTLGVVLRDQLGADGSTLAAGGDLTVQAGPTAMARATVQAGGRLAVAGNGIAMDGARLAAVGDTTLNARAGALSASAALVRSQTGAVTVDAASVAAASPTAPAGAQGFIAATDAVLHAATGGIDLSGSAAVAGRDVVIRAAGDVATRQALVSAGHDAALTGAALDNAGGAIDAQHGMALTLGAGSVLGNAGGTIATRGALSIDSEASAGLALLDNRNGRIETASSLALRAQRTDNREGSIVALAGLDARGGAIDNTRGTLAAQGDVALDTQGGALLASGGRILSQQGRITATAGALDLTGVELRARGDLTLRGSGDPADGHLAGQGARIVSTAGAVDLQLGTAAAQFADATFQSGTRTVLAAGDTGLDRTRIDAGDDVAVRTATLQARQLAVQTQGTLRIDAGGSADLAATRISADGNVAVRAASGLALGGGVVSAQAVDLAAGASRLDLSGATVRAASRAAGSVLRLQGQGIDHANARTASGSDLRIDAGTGAIDNRGGRLTAAGASSVAGRGLDNRDGIIAANGSVSIDARTGSAASAVPALDNTGGVLRSAQGSLRLAAGSLVNGASLISAAQDLTVAAEGTIENASGTLSAGRDLAVSARIALDNTGGGIVAGRHGDVSAGAIDNTAGLLGANGALSVATTAGGIANAKGAVQSGQALVVRAAGAFGNAQGRLQSNATLDLDSAAFDNARGTVAAQGKAAFATGMWSGAQGSVAAGGALTLDTRGGLLDASRGTLDAGGALALTTGTARLTEARATAGGDFVLRASGDVQVARAQIQAGGDATIAAAGSLDLRQTRVAAGQDLSVVGAGATWNSGVQLRAGRDLSMGLNSAIDFATSDTQYRFGRDLSARGIGIRTAGITIAARNLSLDATSGLLDNTGGTVQAAGTLDARGTGIANQGGVFGADGSVTADAAGGTLANGSGRIFSNGGNTAIAGAVVDNHGGTLSGAGDLSIVGGRFDNRGSRAVAGNRLSATLSGALDNSAGGQLVANAGSLSLAGRGIDNHGGTMYGAGGLAVDAGGGALDNATGRIATGGSATVAAGSIDNHGNSVVQAANDLSVSAATLSNAAGGRLSAGAALTVQGQGGGTTAFDNSGGQASGTRVSVRGSLDNAAGVVSGRSSVAIAGGGVVNDAGVIEAGNGGMSIDTAGAALSNRNSGANRGIVSTGDIAIAAGTLNNQRGYIGANGSLVTAARGIDNRGGTLLALGNGTVTTGGTLDNREGAITSGQNLAVNASRLDNSGASSVVFAAGNLRISAVDIDNHGTRDGSGRHGLLAGGDLAIGATSLDNRSGAIVGLGRMEIVAARGVDNSDGQIGAKRVTVRTPSLTNTGGRIDATDYLMLEVPNFSADGILASNGTLALHTQGDYTNTGTIAARGSLDIATTGRYTNQGTISAEDRLLLSARSLDNQAGATITARTTSIEVTGDVTNAGLINASAGRLSIGASGTIDNTGRLYGDEIALRALRLDNRGTAVVAARAGDIGVGADVRNTGGAQIVSLGSLSIGGGLRNEGSLVSASRDVSVAGRTDNLMTGLVLGTSRTTAPHSAEYIVPAGTTLRVPRNETVEAGEVIILPSARYPFATFGSNKRALDAQEQACTTDGCTPTGRYTYADDDAIWGLFGVARPDYSGLVQPTLPANQPNGCMLGGSGGDSSSPSTRDTVGACGAYWSDLDTYESTRSKRRETASKALNAEISAFNTSLKGRSYEDFLIQTVTTRETTTTTATGGAPGQIRAGGDVRFSGGGINQDSIVVAHGAVVADDGLNNIATQGETRTVDSGTSRYRHVESCGAFGTKHCIRLDAPSAFVAAPEVRTAPIVLPNLGTGTASAPGDNPAPLAGQAAVMPRMNATVVVRSDAAAPSGAAAPPAAGSTALAGGRIVAVPGTDAPGAAVQAGAAGTPAAAGLLAVRRTSEVAAAEATAARVDAADGAHVGGSAAATDAPLSGSVIAASARTHQATAIDTVQAQFATAAAALPVRYTITARGPPALVGGALPTAPETIDGRSAAAPGAVKAAGYTTVRSAVALALPASQLFRIPAHAGVHYLVETDPAFTNYQNFLSSDYFLTQLKLDPERSLKRYTDGFGEQRLLDDQIMALTGRRFLSGYADTQSEYTALMASGVAFAQQYHLTPGTTLSAEQMAQLTTDIVWLENQSVTLADGSTTTALVPRVYLRQPQAGDLGPTGSLIAARDITLTTPGDLVNSGTLRAHGTNAAADDGTLALRADNLTNSGTLTAGTVTAQARTDLANLGGQIVGIGAGSNVMLAAGRDLILRTTTQTHTATTATSTSSRTNADRIATVQGGSVSLQAARDLLSHGATVAATAGDLQASAGRDLVVAAVDERYSLEIGDPHGRTVNGQRTRTAESRSTPLGSSLGASGNLRLSAGADATVLGSTVAAGRNLEISGADVTVGAATASESFAATGVGRHDFHSASETRTTAVGSRLTAGRELAVTANGKPADGQGDIAVQGSSLNAGTGTLALAATRDLAIGTAATSSAESGADYNRSRGLLSTTTGQSSHERTTAGVQGSSLGGATVIASAGRDLGVTGSSVVADGNLTLLAGHDLNIAAATETTRSDSSRAQSKSGLMGSGGIGFMVGSRVQEAAQQGSGTTSAASTVGSIGGNVTLGAGNAYRQTGSDVIAPAGDIAIVARTVAITESRDSADSRTEQKFRQSGLTVAVTAPVISALQSAIGTAEATGATRDGRMAALGAASTALSLHSAAGAMQSASAAMDAGKGVGEAAHIGISITAGSSHSTTTTTQHSNTARDSTLQAGGNLRIDASGAGRDSGITLQGTRVMAGQDVDLKAEGDIALRAARNNSEQHTRSASNSAAAGVAITFGPNGAAFGITASASGARGKADGTDTTWSNTRIDAGRRVGLQSGGDTTLRGASVAAPKISAQVGGDLKIESLQDTSRYASKNQSLGGSVTLGIGASGSASASSAKVHADYASVTEQSGLKAGDGGFQIHVGGATNLRGGALTSSEAAVQSGANRFASAGGLTTEDLRNRDDYRASGASLSGGYGKADGSSGGLQKFTGGMNGGAAGIGSASGHQSNTTASAISGVAGDTRARTDGKRDAALTRNWDGSQLEREVQAQTQITAAFGQQASKAVGDYATQQYDRLKDNDPSEAEKWKEGGAYRIAAHSVIGGLTGGLQGALGAGTSQAVIDQIAKQIASTDLPPGLKTALTAIAGTSVGAAVGGSAGTAAAGNATVNNYLNHVRPNPMRLSEVERYEAAAAACGHGDAAACETRNALAQTSVQRDRELAQACSGSTPGACAVKVGEATAMGNTVRTTESGYVFAASPTLTPLNPSTIGNPKRPDSLHDTLAQSTADGLLVEVGNQAVAAVVAPLVKATGAVIGAVKGSVGDLTPSTTAVAATDGSATSVYSSDGRAYGSTALTDAKGNVIPTQPALQSTSGNGGVGAKGIDKIFEAGRTPKASELKEYAEAQGWKPSQTDGGPLKYVDENGIPRVTIKQGSSRAPGSSDPHVEFKDATGQRTDAFGNPVTRKSLGNHTSIDFDL